MPDQRSKLHDSIHEKLGALWVSVARFHWTAAPRPISFCRMKQLRSILARCLMVVIMAMLVTGSIGMNATDAAQTDGSAQITDHAARHGSDCSTMDKTGAPVQKSHAACTMTVCCFSEIPDFSAVWPEARPLQVGYARAIAARLTQAEPKRAKKPPKHA
ncbi:hypothetical protein [Roseobacter sp. AzwK-3b]|uniref:hypothetical protein n=1 Tax=Roseobacter sp. AzwK-3b TaxID=351016 RepID=UPI0018DD57D9|nr:hypothetical protein [Roseobacter sp. AzwK-3b]